MSRPFPLAELRARIDHGETSSIMLTTQALDRILDPAGEGERAFTRVYDVSARRAAEAADRTRSDQPLRGIPICVKDLFDIAGESTMAGSIALEHAAPATVDAPVIQRLRAAGAIIVGKTNMTEFAYSGLGLNPHFGTPCNPFDRLRIPGGSSSGAGVAVPLGFAAASIGTDTGGSVRIPAAFCGLVGFKPTQRRVPTAGMVPLSTSLDSVGPLAPTVACCALLDAILAGEQPTPLEQVPIRGLRLGLPTRRVTENLGQTVSKLFDQTLGVLSGLGAKIEGFLPTSFGRLDAMQKFGGIAGPEAYAWHKELLNRRANLYDPRVRVRLEISSPVLASDYIAALDQRRLAIAAFEHETAGFDAVIMPTVAIVPPRFDEVTDDGDFDRVNHLVLRNPSTINQLDGCAVTVPILEPGSLPVGITIAGRAGMDRRVLEIAHAIERAVGRRE